MAIDRKTSSILNIPIRPSRSPALIVRGSHVEERQEALSGEEPLQIRACGPGQEPTDVAITMRTPGSEEELALGFLVSEGLVSSVDAAGATFAFGDPARIARPEDEILVRIPSGLELEAVAERHFVATASCGICGRASLDELVARVSALPQGHRLRRSVLTSLSDTMREAQVTFEETGGLHAAASFDLEGHLLDQYEDVGRHNAVDKVIGSAARQGRLPLADVVLMVSGRTSFEIVQKAASAGVAILAAVSAPSDLAVETADRLGMTLIGFLRDDGFNVYSRSDRIDLEDGR